MGNIDRLKTMKEQLESCVQSQLGNLEKVDAKQLGQAIDMIKDLSEAIYYCTITQSMEKVDKQKEQASVNNINYYTTPEYRGMERAGGYMYYPSGNGGQNTGSTSYYTPMVHDPRQGKSPMRRRMYMEGKEMHKDMKSQLQELEAYMHELSSDITEMIKDASPQERRSLKEKMTTLASKIN